MKRTQAALRNAPHISQNLLTKILNNDAETVTRRDVKLEVDTVTKIRTPYGPLIEFMELPVAEPQGDECSFSWCYANPFALLWELCRRSKGFSSLLEEAYTNTSQQLHCIAFYSDEATGGNQLRPDNKNQIQCFYYALLFLPHWLRRRMHGWLPFAVMRGVTQKKILGNLSYIWTRFLRTCS